MSDLRKKKDWYTNFFISHYLITPVRKGFDSLIQKGYPFDAPFDEQYESVQEIKHNLDPYNKNDNFASVFLYGSLYDDVVRTCDEREKQFWTSFYGHVEYDLARKLDNENQKENMFASSLKHFLVSKEFGNYRAINARCIGKSYLQLHDYKKANKFLQIAWDHGDDGKITAGMLAKSYLKMNHVDQAQKYFAISRALGDTSAENKLYLDECKELMNYNITSKL